MLKHLSIISAALILMAATLLSPAESLAEDRKLPPGDAPPPDVFSRVKQAGTAADHQGADLITVYHCSVNKVKESGVTYVDDYFVQKVLTAAGCRERSVLRWSYDPLSSYVEVREANIIRGGEKIPVDVSEVHDLPAPQRAIYWKDRVMTLQLPRLKINDGIEVKIFRKGFTYALLNGSGSGSSSPAAGPAQAKGQGEFKSRQAAGDDSSGEPGDEKYIPPMPGEYFDIVLFAESDPIIEMKYVLSLPAGKRLHSEVYNGPLYSSTTYTEERNEYAWWGFDLAPRPSEPSQPAPSDYVTKVVMATVENWEAKSRWFFDVNRNQFEVTPEIKKKVDEIFEKAGVSGESEEVKAEVLLHWVAQNIRYSGQTMGKGEGFMLHPGWMIFEQRSGVCKDIAGMLITMMRAAGMDSYAAMTMAGSRIEEVPADQFNHCVCALRKEDGSFVMYDPTWVPFNNNIWSLLETEQHYLIGTPRGEGLARIRYSPPEESPLRVKHHAELGGDGTLEGKIRLSGSGAVDGRLRRLINYSPRAETGATLAGLFSAVSGRVEITEYRFHDIDDFSSDMWIEIRYRIPRFGRAVDGGLEFTSPMMGIVLNHPYLFRAGTARWKDERETDVFLYYTQLVEGTEDIRLPRGYEAVETPSSDEIDETYAYFKGTSDMDGRTLRVTQRAEVRRRQIPPEGYPGFRKAIEEAKEWSEIKFRAEKGDR